MSPFSRPTITFFVLRADSVAPQNVLPMLLTVLRLVAIPVGVLAYYAAFFMYEDEEGKWQSRIETLWVAVNDREKLTGNRTSALFNKVAGVTTRGFNRVFGSRLFSFQSVGVSTGYALAALFLSVSLIMFAILLQSARLRVSLPHHFVSATSLIGYFCLAVGIICLTLAVLPSLLPSPWTVALSLFPFLLITAGTIKTIWLHGPLAGLLPVYIALLASFLSDVLLLALVRFVVRRISEETGVFRLAVAVLIQVGVITVLVVAPFQWAGSLMVKFGQKPELRALLALGIFNAFTGIASSVFLLMLLVVLLHKAIWPVLGRLLHSMARHQVIRNHWVTASLGTACFIFAFPQMSGTLKAVLEWIAK
jgi:hypothetical protein